MPAVTKAIHRMAFKIYRFELLSEVGRSGGNVIYDVKDTVDNSRACLYEWTPQPEKAAEAYATFSSLTAQLNNLETFTAGPRLYLVDFKSQARKELEVLRSHGLFSGNWPGLFDELPVPAGSVNAGLSHDSETKANYSAVWMALFFLESVVVLVLVIWIVSLHGEIDQIKNDREKTQATGQVLYGQMETLQHDLDSARSELNRQKAFLAKHQDSEADMAYAAFHLAEESVKPSSGYYELSLENQCSAAPLFVVARYLDLQDRWVTRGWWKVSAGQFVPLDMYSKNGIIYLYAENNGKQVTLSDTNDFESISEDILMRDFIHPSSEILTDPDKRTISMIRLHLTPGSFQLKASFPCPPL
jgi:hypothetical protein